MKKIEKIEANGFYVLVGKSNSNSCFIEKLIHAKKFLIYANYFLKDYLKIYDYVITKDGWSMVVKISSKKRIKELEGTEHGEVWRIISERVRLFLSTFVRVTNKEKGRTGCLVHSCYERYCFESKDEALRVIDRMRKQQVKFYGKKKKYRALKTHYRIGVQASKGSVFLCSKDLRRRKEEVVEIGEVLGFTRISNVVVEKMVNFTLKQQIPPNPPNPPNTT